MDLLNRLKEPTNCIAIAVLVYAFFPDMDLAPVKEILTAVLAAVGIVMREKGG